MVTAIARSSAKTRFGTSVLCCLRRGVVTCTLIFLLAEHICVPADWEGFGSYDERALEKPRVISNDRYQVIPLGQLTALSKTKQCSNPRHVHIDNIEARPENDRLFPPRTIPRIIHQTSRSSCVTERIAWTIRRWRKFPDFQYYLHDDDAMMRLLQQEFPEFPQLSRLVRHCLLHGTVRADLWRYVVLWVYGGIYADIDAVPALFHPEDSIGNADAYFVVEQYHLLSQWFMAVSPRHPIMYYAIQHSLANLVHVADTGSIPGECSKNAYTCSVPTLSNQATASFASLPSSPHHWSPCFARRLSLLSSGRRWYRRSNCAWKLPGTGWPFLWHAQSNRHDCWCRLASKRIRQPGCPGGSQKERV